ncbi:hypothetical protein [Pleomorphomonas carboxyditropha]|uniref:Uncharacterized protein n=1 Tax=Pleomorphomonas carboxyditropha TaxID=2023338 RepID=A0A2G9X1A4_9HYPH|nr:hypothetical protein [Pleomorphomonas carboxyditropha]PIP00684.1 hypothetical protein CJ014_00845 [Pleomorphomonas carboxyditropha]
MATKATVPEIETRFVLSGLDDSLRQMSAFSSKVKGEFGSIEKAAAVNVKPLSGLGNALAGIQSLGSKASSSWRKFGSDVSASIKPIHDGMGKLGNSIVTVGNRLSVVKSGFSTMAVGATRAIGGIGLAVTGLVGTLAGAGVAAAKISLGFADKVDDLGDKASAIGFEPVELQGLDLLASQGGLETDALVQGIALVSTSAKQLYDGFNQQDKKLAETLEEKAYEFNKAKAELLQAQSNPSSTSSDQMKDAFDRMKNAEAEFDEVRKSSYNASKDALAQLYAVDKSKLNADELHQLTVRTHEYQDALSALETSAGPAGSALLKLHDQYGLNLEQVSKGAPEALKEILRVFPQITDATERLQLAMDLFGTKPGRKFVGVLQGGIGGFDAALAKVKALGADIQDVDAEIADTWDATNHELTLAMDGIRRTISRSITPEITNAVNSLNQFMVRNNQSISAYFVAAFERLKTFAEDVVGLFQGQRTGFQTQFLDAIVNKLAAAWAFAKNLAVEIGKAWDGKSDLAWLNLLVSRLQEAGRFAEEFARVMTGQGAAVEFPWLNDMPEKAQRFIDSLGKIVEAIGGIITVAGDLLRAVGDVFGVDPMTLGIGIGLLKLSGLLGTLTAGFSLLGSVAKVGLGVAGAELAVAGSAAGTAATGAASLGAGATAAGVLGKLGGAGALLSRLAIAPALVYGGWKLGEYGGDALGHWLYDPMVDKAIDDTRAVGDESLAQYRPKMNSRPDLDAWYQSQADAARMFQGYQANANALVPTETVNINLTAPDGKTATLKASKADANSTIGILTGALSGRTAGAF